MLKKKKLRSHFAGSQTDTDTMTQTSLEQTGTVLLNIYRNITELPLKRFKACLLYGDYNALIKEGKAERIILLEAWKEIEQQYTEKIAGKKGKRYLDLQIEVLILDGKFKMIKRIANIMALVLDINGEEYKELGSILNRLTKSDFTFDDEDRFKEIQRCVNRSNSMLIVLELKQIQLAEMSKGMDGVGVTVNEEYFADALIKFTNFWKVPLTDDMTTYEFCRRTLDYNKEVKQINDANQPVRRRNK